MNALHRCAVAALLLAGAHPALGQPYPAKTIRFIAPKSAPDGYTLLIGPIGQPGDRAPPVSETQLRLRRAPQPRSAPESVRAEFADELAKWGRVIAEAKLKPE
jgi:hypothetical protein